MQGQRVLIAGLLVASAGAGACSPAGSPAPPSVAASVAGTVTSAPTAAPTSIVFTSPRYGYVATAPLGWEVTPATRAWTGTPPPPGHADDEVDKFIEPQAILIFAFAGPTTLSLDAYVSEQIAATVAAHPECPAGSQSVSSIAVAATPARLVVSNCGLLINLALVVRNGRGYQFVLRDPGIKAATSPADTELFATFLASVSLPG